MEMWLKNKKAAILILLSFLLLTPVKSAAEGVDVKAIVFEHLRDSYEWHITNWGEKEIFISLPVIVKGQERGWYLFSSSHLRDGAQYEGFQIAREGEHAGKIVEINSAGEEIRPLDLSLTKTVLALMINCVVLLLIILPLARWYKKTTYTPPKGFRGAVEMLLMDIQEELIKPCIGEHYKRFTPYLLTVFFFIFVNNLMGLMPFFPGGANVTGNIAITMVLAVCTLLVVNFSGNKAYWKEVFWPDVPVWLKVPLPIIPLIEIVGVFTKPFALMIRLFANIMAGHSVILGLICLIFITVAMGAAVNTSMSVVAVLFTIFMNLVELLVAYIQAYVFTLLSAVFIGLSTAKHHAE